MKSHEQEAEDLAQEIAKKCGGVVNTSTPIELMSQIIRDDLHLAELLAIRDAAVENTEIFGAAMSPALVLAVQKYQQTQLLLTPEEAVAAIAKIQRDRPWMIR